MSKQFRKILLPNSNDFFILTNAEIWYNLKKSELKKIEELERCRLWNVFSTQISCHKEALHLESGTIYIGTLIKS